MGEPTALSRKSWESLSSTFSNLEVSLSQDSSYASDEISVVSSNPTTVDTSIASSQGPPSESKLRPCLKSILKKPETEPEEEDAQSESGYGTDVFDCEYETMSEREEEEEEEELYEVSICWDTDDAMSEIVSEDEDGMFDDSFIAFESMVRFDPNVQYIEAPELKEDEGPDTGLTCHELMEMARSSGSLQTFDGENPTAIESTEEHWRNAIDSEEYPGDTVDVDRQLFVAYVNGIKEIADSQYKGRLRALVDDIRLGQAETPYLETNCSDGVYMDHALNHVIGVFRNLLVPDEFEELVALSSQKMSLTPQTKALESHNASLMDRIQKLLVERLAQGNVDVEADELSFFAGGVTYALENWKVH
ncbi:uncharacterized protein EURHEDRAFT_461687 [Aspergillus ruber CBS 135680]|uniref:Uncharacterized protein n=1 Tax=Aspergillus ruber (strain CBS 135680) TaxID=1388766 RepID=A0A017S787_ASPRC|nr:uncharacterized protein EURHEDRAFT_461687 [Aspergillus ruber CBS 135680]EYE92827.1 hypothetical protein EURHEDRAFT_461687 [Aspergillus ruber CBS 135680]